MDDLQRRRWREGSGNWSPHTWSVKIRVFAAEVSTTTDDEDSQDEDSQDEDSQDEDSQDEEGDDDEPVSVPALPLAGAAILAGLLALAGTRGTSKTNYA